MRHIILTIGVLLWLAVFAGGLVGLLKKKE